MASPNFALTMHDIIHAGLEDMDDTVAAMDSLVDSGLDAVRIHPLLNALSHACDPNTALHTLVTLVGAWHRDGDDLMPALSDGRAMNRLIAVLGGSEAMGTLMRSRPDLVTAATFDPLATGAYDRGARRRCMLAAIGANPDDPMPRSTQPLAQATSSLRRCYYTQLAAIMAEDLTHADPMGAQPEISGKLSDLADCALEGALAIARHEVEYDDGCRFTVIAMGKLGARELNYVSDVDLIYVVEPANPENENELGRLTRVGTVLATTMQRVCQSAIAGVGEPTLWQIDGGLRPEGKDGPLVRRLDAHREYYDRWAQNWEFQALLKARPAAGDAEIGATYMTMTRPLVWSASHRENFVNDCQQMRRRVEDLIPAPLRDREVKLGKGGLRDVEFTVQMLQLVHGRTDTNLRCSDTLTGLRVLSQGGYISRNQAARLALDYRFERVIEHRQQMWGLKRTHLFPDIAAHDQDSPSRGRERTALELGRNPELRRLARAFDMRPDQLVAQFHDVLNEVRRLHMDIYYRPMLPINAQLDDDQVQLSESAMRDRFASIGFADPDAAIRHVRALSVGVSRASRINRILLPSVLQWLGHGQNPDMGLLHWRRLEERFGEGSPYLGLLRDSPMAARRLCHVLSNSRYLGDALTKSVESVGWLSDDAMLRARSRHSLDVQCRATNARYAEDLTEFATSLRAMRRREIERIGLAWANRTMDDDTCLHAMTDVYDALIDSALAWSIRASCRAHGATDAPATLAVLALGRYGGAEVNFSSDADAIVIYRRADGVDEEHANRFAQSVVDQLRAVLQGPSTLEPRLELDLDLRPEGRNGPLVRSYASCEEYYAHWASTWEHQALLRARHAAGDGVLATDFLERIADPLRYPDTPPGDVEIGEIRRLKARMEAERLPRGVRRERHLKLGRGGLSDVEWAVQSLQLCHAGRHPELRVTSTLPALEQLESLDLVDHADADVLRRAWRMCTAARNGNYLWSGRPSTADIIPDDLESLGGVAVYLGYPAHRGQYFDNDLLAVMRQCREVVERLFYGDAGRTWSRPRV